MNAKPKLTIPEVITRFQAYYAKHPAWGSLHIVLDDGNVRDDSVYFCIKWAIDHEDPEGEALARILLQMSKTQWRRQAHQTHIFQE